MKKPFTKPTEHKCPACNGTGYPVVTRPVRPGRKIYPAPCKKCGGKGRITEDAYAGRKSNPGVLVT
jgi:DnaJ-class molecular chaperone